jgi:hypothetical protein
LDFLSFFPFIWDSSEQWQNSITKVLLKILADRLEKTATLTSIF